MLPLSLSCVSKYSLFLLSNNIKVFENEVFVSITRFLNFSMADSFVFSTSLDNFKYLKIANVHLIDKKNEK